jgi:hypothetical protein
MYSDVSSKWIMPATHYTFTWGNVGFIALDTNAIMWGNTEQGDQAAWYTSALTEVAGADWVFLLGHHPLRSNGSHGNAGTYESPELNGTKIPLPIPVLNGAAVKDFFDAHVCGTVDAYFCGHDHTRQWIDEPEALCGAELIVTGAGAKLTALASELNQAHYQDDEKAGFMYVVIEGNTFTGQFIDQDGNVDYERTVTR